MKQYEERVLKLLADIRQLLHAFLWCFLIWAALDVFGTLASLFLR